MAFFVHRTILAAALTVLVPGTAAAQLASPPTQAQIEKAQRHLRDAMQAAEQGNWRVALEQYQESRAAASSIVAIDGVANAQYHLQHDQEARAAYEELLAQNPQFGPSDRALQQEWVRMTSIAKQRIAEIDARKDRAANAGARPAPPDYSPRRRDLHGKYYDGEDAEEERTAHNVVFAELLGNGILWSINYERLFGDSNFSVRVGFSYMALNFGGTASNGTAVAASTSWITVPLLANYYVGSGSSKLHLGLGMTLLAVTGSGRLGSVFGSADSTAPCPTLVVGYRYLPPEGGFAFSVGFTPFIVPSSDTSVVPWGGTSFGGVF